MRTAIISAPRSVELRGAHPSPPDTGDVRVRIEGTGVCASSLPVWQGRPWFTYPLEPGAPGHEAWGKIEAVGASVEHLAIGSRVALLSYHAFAEWDVAPANAVVLLPESIDAWAFPGEPLACAANVFGRSAIHPGQRVAVIGIGFLGALLVALAHHAGAEVTAVSRRSFARDVARQMGASRVLPFGASLDADFDCVIEAVGTQEALDLASTLPRTRGRLVIAGYHQDGPRTVDLQSWNWRGIDVINAHERDPQIYVEGIRTALDLVSRRVLDPTPLFTHRLALDELPRAFELLEARPDGFMKALVMM